MPSVKNKPILVRYMLLYYKLVRLCNKFVFISAIFITGDSQVSAVVSGVWGYNGFLAAGSAVFFLTPSLNVLLLAILNAVSATIIHAVLLPVFAAVSTSGFTIVSNWNYDYKT